MDNKNNESTSTSVETNNLAKVASLRYLNAQLLEQCKRYKHLLNELIKDGEIHCMEDRDELMEVLSKVEK